MKITGLYSYPLKSGKAISMESTDVLSTGFVNDRTLVVIDENNKVITGREIPELTSITVQITDNILTISKEGWGKISFALPFAEHHKVVSFKLFRNKVSGLLCDATASGWLSDVLGTKCRLVFIKDNYRPIDPNRGGMANDLVGYADASPIHLITEASLQALNAILVKKVTALHFRPNLVVHGGEAYAEDHWKIVTINDCEFEVHHHCKRCIFTTIDPVTAARDENMEPLTTLAKFRKERNEKLTFGIYLVPRKTGNIQLGNKVVKVI